MVMNRRQPPIERIGIPARGNSFAVFARARERGARGKNSAPFRAVQHERPKASFDQAVGCLINKCLHTGSARIKSSYFLTKLRAVPKRGMPEGRNMSIQFHHQASFNQAFHHSGEGNACPSCERFDKQARCGGQSLQPVANVGNKPGLATRITKRTVLWHTCDVYSFDWRCGYSIRFAEILRAEMVGLRMLGGKFKH